MVGDENQRPHIRPSIKSHVSFNNYSTWKHKLRENCYRRVRDDRTRLLWKLRLPEADNQSRIDKDFIRSSFKDIVSDELKKLKESSLNDNFGTPSLPSPTDDTIWEYDGLHTAYEGDCEEMLLEMQRIFYEDLRSEDTRKGNISEDTRKESESCTRTWEDEEDEYLARAVFEHMQLNGEQVKEEVWCPICKQGELHQNSHFIYCTLCKLKLERGDEVNLELLRIRLAEAHAEHLDRGCRLKPEFCIETRFELTALYIRCHGCNTFEVVI